MEKTVMTDLPSVMWIVLENRGGIRSYSESLIPEFGSAVLPVWTERDLWSISASPKIIHIQHEFGLFGSKFPGLNRFPRFVQKLRKQFPGALLVATAHTVIRKDFKYSLSFRGVGSVPREILNTVAVPFFISSWTRGTWSLLDGVVVHSDAQVETVRESGQNNVVVIPHFLPVISADDRVKFQSENAMVVFGYFSPEKGQDIAIRAWKILASRLGSNTPRLVLAGGPRLSKDNNYFKNCLRLIRASNLSEFIEVLGFIPEDKISDIYKSSGLVLAPFRETSGSGSLAQAMSRGAAVLASDLPLNLEIEKRAPGSMRFFSSGDPIDLADQIEKMTGHSLATRQKMGDAAVRYADANSPSKIASLHRAFYRTLCQEFS